MEALKNAQVDELLLDASIKEIRGEGGETTEPFLPDVLVTALRKPERKSGSSKIRRF
jgi:hypothetical protein